jgi:hypothetical protein
MILLLAVGSFLLLLVALALLGRAVLGPDPDLEAPWTPPDRRPACGDWSCRVDHRALGQWNERRPR